MSMLFKTAEKSKTVYFEVKATNIAEN